MGLARCGGQNLPFPIPKASGLYNRLYYRTSRDGWCKSCIVWLWVIVKWLCVRSMSGGVYQHRGEVLLYAWLELQYWTSSSVLRSTLQRSGVRQEDWGADWSPRLAFHSHHVTFLTCVNWCRVTSLNVSKCSTPAFVVIISDMINVC